ncbi:hypothetical protein [Nocardia asiatica]|uniref:hypothetical protein n=1 Tax=Nocardia asiatica TaxID=209252 RepID=UPI000308D319|nr:hypothetical protein [Nocardia asiatica]
MAGIHFDPKPQWTHDNTIACQRPVTAALCMRVGGGTVVAPLDEHHSRRHAAPQETPWP